MDSEFHRIERTSEGPVLTPRPRGWRASRSRPFVPDPYVVRENPQHDFPQRIVYERVAADSLVVRVEAAEGETERAVEWRMARTACPG